MRRALSALSAMTCMSAASFASTTAVQPERSPEPAPTVMTLISLGFGPAEAAAAGLEAAELQTLLARLSATRSQEMAALSQAQQAQLAIKQQIDAISRDFRRGLKRSSTAVSEIAVLNQQAALHQESEGLARIALLSELQVATGLSAQEIRSLVASDGEASLVEPLARLRAARLGIDPRRAGAQISAFDRSQQAQRVAAIVPVLFPTSASSPR